MPYRRGRHGGEGSPPPGEADALAEALSAGVIVVQSTRAGSGVVPLTTRLAERALLRADDLTPQKARMMWL